MFRVFGIYNFACGAKFKYWYYYTPKKPVLFIFFFQIWLISLDVSLGDPRSRLLNNLAPSTLHHDIKNVMQKFTENFLTQFHKSSFKGGFLSERCGGFLLLPKKFRFISFEACTLIF